MSLFDFVQPIKYLSDEVREPKEIDFVLPGLPIGSIGAIVSPGGLGKSMFALQLSTQLAAPSSSDLLGFGELKRRRVAYLPAEDPRQIIANRMHAISKHYSDAELVAADENMIVVPVLGQRPNLAERGWIDFLRRLAGWCDIIILDTLRRWHTADENDSGAMAHIISVLEWIAQEHKCSFLFLHHTSKVTALGGQGNAQQASRGSSVLVDNIRWQLNLVNMTEQEAKNYCVSDRNRYVKCVNSKSNYGASMAEKWFERTKGGVLCATELSGGGVSDV
jgi:hypothetical protein